MRVDVEEQDMFVNEMGVFLEYQPRGGRSTENFLAIFRFSLISPTRSF